MKTTPARPTSPPEFQAVFNRLRTILATHRGSLTVIADSPNHYCLGGEGHPTHKGPYPIAWVQIGKNYVGFHHMGVYCSPELLAKASKKLNARMQGKSCFNFKTMDEPLFEELDHLTIHAFESFKQKMAVLKSKSATGGFT